jgi:hypothetical protein
MRHPATRLESAVAHTLAWEEECVLAVSELVAEPFDI